MQEIVRTDFDYNVLDETTRVFVKVATVDIHSRLKRTADDIIAIGEQLLAVKEKLEHGLYVQWLKTEFDMSQATAYRFVAVAEKDKTNPEFITVINSKRVYRKRKNSRKKEAGGRNRQRRASQGEAI